MQDWFKTLKLSFENERFLKLMASLLKPITTKFIQLFIQFLP